MFRLIISVLISINFVATGFRLFGQGMCSFSGRAGGRVGVISTNLSSADGVISCNVTGFGLILIVIVYWIYMYRDAVFSNNYSYNNSNSKETYINEFKNTSEENISNYESTRVVDLKSDGINNIISKSEELSSLKEEIEQLIVKKNSLKNELENINNENEKKENLISEIENLRRDLKNE